MEVIVDTDGTVNALDAVLRKVSSREDVQGLIVLAAAENGFSPGTIDPLLRSQELPLIGGIFPAILAGTRKLERGSIVVGLTAPVRTMRIDGLDRREVDFVSRIDERLPVDVPSNTSDTVLVMVDAFASRIDSFLESVYTVFGPDRTYLGGGTGTLAMDRSPSLLTNEGIVADSAVLALIDVSSSLGVRHGWTQVAGPFRVTDADGSVIRALDWEPAFSVYRNVIKEAGGGTIREDNFFEIARAFPFGLQRIDGDLVVRDPFAVEEGERLVCVGSVPNGSFLQVLRGDDDSLIAAAAEAAEMCSSRGHGVARSEGSAGIRVFFDCISRVLFLEDRFTEELAVVYDPDRPLVGACSIGEVANNGDSFLEFFNKTAVVADLDTGA